VREVCTLGNEQRLEICDGLAKLRADAVEEFACLYAKLAGADNPIARSNDGAIGTRRYGKWIPRSRGISDRSS
jgi:hypothetical protein